MLLLHVISYFLLHKQHLYSFSHQASSATLTICFTWAVSKRKEKL